MLPDDALKLRDVSILNGIALSASSPYVNFLYLNLFHSEKK